MPYTIDNESVTVPGKWRFRIPGLDANVGYVSGHWSYRDLETEVIKRYRANGRAVPGNLKELIIDQLCRDLPDGYCRDTSPLAAFGLRFVHEFNRILNGTQNLLDLKLREGGKLVDQEEADRRSQICATCVFNKPITECPTCNKPSISAIVQKIVGGGKTAKHAALTACQICGCDLKAKVWFPMEVLNRHLTDQQRNQFPPAHGSQPACWIRETETVT